MNSWLKQELTPIGLDLGRHQIKAIQLCHTAEGAYAVHGALVLPRLDPQEDLCLADLQRLKLAMSHQNFVGRDLVISTPGQMVHTQVLELPPRQSGAPVEQIARMELARCLECSEDAFEYGAWDIPTPARGGTSSHMMTASCTHVEAEPLLDQLQALGWHVRAMDVSALAIARLYSAGRWDHQGMVAVVDIGATSVSYVLLMDKTVIYDRQLEEVGIGQLYDTLGENLDIPADMIEHIVQHIGLVDNSSQLNQVDRTLASYLTDAGSMISRYASKLIEEIEASVSYARHRYPQSTLDHLLVHGGGALLPGITDRIAQTLSVEVKTLKPSDGLVCPDALREICQSAALSSSAGLAMYVEE